MSDEFATNVNVPPTPADVPQFVFPEGDFTEKTQTMLTKIDADEAGRRLLIRQLKRKILELERQVEDLEHAKDLCE